MDDWEPSLPLDPVLLKLGFLLIYKGNDTKNTSKPSYWVEPPQKPIELSTLEELIALKHQVGYRLIVGANEITIYDGHLE